MYRFVLVKNALINGTPTITKRALVLLSLIVVMKWRQSDQKMV